MVTAEHGIDYPAGRPHHRHRSIAHRDERRQPAWLALTRHDRQVRARIDEMSQFLAVPDFEMTIRVGVEVVLGRLDEQKGRPTDRCRTGKISGDVPGMRHDPVRARGPQPPGPHARRDAAERSPHLPEQRHTAPEAVGRSRLYLYRLLGKGWAGPRLVRRVLSVQFSGGLAGPGESAAGSPSAPYEAAGPPGVHGQRHVSTAVVSTALARSAVPTCAGSCRLPASAWSA